MSVPSNIVPIFNAGQRQLKSSARTVSEPSCFHPAFFARYRSAARAYQLRNLTQFPAGDDQMAKAKPETPERSFFEKPTKPPSAVGAGGRNALETLKPQKGA